MPDLIGRVRRRMLDEHAGLADIVQSEAGPIADDATIASLHARVAAELHGAGPLEPVLGLLGVTDVLVNAPDSVWFDRGRGLERSAVSFPDDAAIRRLAQRLAGSAGRRLDDAMPFVDAALPDGTRLHAVLPPLVAHPTVSLRVLARQRYGLADLVSSGALAEPVAELLRSLVAARLAFVITGGTGSGKTTLLAAMLGCCDRAERLIVIEDAPELAIDHGHLVRLLPKTPNVEGAGQIGPRTLVRNALRMRPDRLIVGEFRGAEMVDLLVALNTGHDGGAATMHANSASDVPARFTALGALGGLSRSAVTSLVASAVHVIVHLRRDRRGLRAVDEIAMLHRAGDELVVSTVWSAGGGRGAGAPSLAAFLDSRRCPVPVLVR